LQALFLEYAKRNLRSVRDGTESSRSCIGEGFSWNRFSMSAATVAVSKRPYSSWPSVVRRLWHGSSPKKDEDPKTLDTSRDVEHSNYGLENVFSDQAGSSFEVDSRSVPRDSGSKQESGYGTAEDGIKLNTGFHVSEQAWQSMQRAEETQDSEPESQKELDSVRSAPSAETCPEREASQDLMFKPNVKYQPQSESSSSKRNWSSTTSIQGTKCTASKAPRSPVPVQSDDTAHSVTSASQFGYSEDYFRLMAHIFNCIFR